MTDREKLVELQLKADIEDEVSENTTQHREYIADLMIANGVVVREKVKWRNNKDGYPECDKCGYMPQYDPMIDDIYLSDFCPNCGSDMRGAVNDG